MPQYLSPGVYVEEVESAVKPIAGVSTSIAGFIGLVHDNVKMPDEPGKFQLDDAGKPVLDDDGQPIPIAYPVAPPGDPILVTNWMEFTSNFGEIQHGNRILAHALYGFFNNGGTRAWAMRGLPTE